MPKPTSGESKDDFLSRCISMLVEQEGHEQNQAIAECEAIWSEHQKPKKEE